MSEQIGTTTIHFPRRSIFYSIVVVFVCSNMGATNLISRDPTDFRLLNIGVMSKEDLAGLVRPSFGTTTKTLRPVLLWRSSHRIHQGLGWWYDWVSPLNTSLCPCVARLINTEELDTVIDLLRSVSAIQDLPVKINTRLQYKNTDMVLCYWKECTLNFKVHQVCAHKTLGPRKICQKPIKMTKFWWVQIVKWTTLGRHFGSDEMDNPFY